MARLVISLVVATADQKETMSRLTPDWEPALEADLSRAIAKVQSQPRPTTTTVDPATVAEVRKRVPDVDSLSLKEATQKLRATAFQEFQATVNEMSPKITDAQQRIQDLETNGSEAEQVAARQRLRELQKQQTDRLQEITQQLSQEIEALQRLKETSLP